MSGGEWLIRQLPPYGGPAEGGYRVERVTIETTASGTDNPTVNDGAAGLSFHYTDGRNLIFPWANIIRAEYRPHPNP